MNRREMGYQLFSGSRQPEGGRPAAAVDEWAAEALWNAPQDEPRRGGRGARGVPINGDFRCGNCDRPVSAGVRVAGVQNRNHCPYCLWSKHLDLHASGDRLAACKGRMRPVGLTLKQTRKKYAPLAAGTGLTGGECLAVGELMLAHECVECGKLSANRIAADDDAEMLLAVYSASLALNEEPVAALAAGGVQLLQKTDAAVVRRRLFGK